MNRTIAFSHGGGGSRQRLLLAVLCLVVLHSAVSSQEKCLAPGRVEELKKQVTLRSNETLDEKLSKEFVALGTELIEAARKAKAGENGKSDEKYKALLMKARSRVCEHLNAAAWPTTAVVTREGIAAFMYLVSKTLPIEMQLEIYPVVAEAFRQNLLERDEFLASYLDRLQLALGQRQLFGSQAFIRDGFLVLAPIERPSQVDVRRKEFKMESLRSYERYLEFSYKMPLIRSVTEPENPTAAEKKAATPPPTAAAVPGLAGTGEEPVIKVATSLVTLDVVVSEPAGANAAPLEKNDFRVFEDGDPVEIESFSRADSPFDIVLLLDLSGSTEKKSGLIKKSTRRFIEMKRPVDRVAVVTFSDAQTVISELEADKAKLLERLKDLEGGGGSLVWDSIKFAQDMLDRGSGSGRRKAIVVMTDGYDNSLNFEFRTGSMISFADLVESVQRGSAAIFPVYLDTEPENAGVYSKRVFGDGRRTLAYLAEQSAGKMYTAKKVEDLNEIYERILKDVGTVYTLGFTSPDDASDGKWRRLRVEVPSRPGIKLWHRPGYFPRRTGP